MLRRSAVPPVAIFLLIAGCASARTSNHADAEVLHPPPNASPTVSAHSSPVEPAQTKMEITIPADGSGEALGLHIDVLSIVEKRTMDGSGLMRVGIRVRDGAETGTIEFESPGNEDATWGRYKLTYRGGWRTEAILRVEKIAPSE